MSNQTVTELKVLAAKSATNYGFDVTDFMMFTHLNPLSIQVNIRHKNPEKKVTIDDCSTLSEDIDEAIQNSSKADTDTVPKKKQKRIEGRKNKLLNLLIISNFLGLSITSYNFQKQ